MAFRLHPTSDRSVKVISNVCGVFSIRSVRPFRARLNGWSLHGKHLFFFVSQMSFCWATRLRGDLESDLTRCGFFLKKTHGFWLFICLFHFYWSFCFSEPCFAGFVTLFLSRKNYWIFLQRPCTIIFFCLLMLLLLFFLFGSGYPRPSLPKGDSLGFVGLAYLFESKKPNEEPPESPVVPPDGGRGASRPSSGCRPST